MKRYILIILFTALLLFPSCSETPAKLFQLPISKPEYQQLQSDINHLLIDGWELSSPSSGELRTTMHFADVTGDGVDEGIILMRSTVSSELRFVIYESADDGYVRYSSTTLTGSAYSKIDFIDITGDGKNEILLGVQYGTEALFSASIYAVNEGDCSLLLDIGCTEWYVYDADMNGHDDILLFQNSENGKDASALLYGYADGSLYEMGCAPLSSGVIKPEKIVFGYTDEDFPVVVVESKYSVEGYISDALVYYDGSFINMGYDETLEINYNYLKPIFLAAADYNLDGYIELPVLDEISRSGDTVFYRADWFSIKPGLRAAYKYSTYNDIECGWYMLYPQNWRYLTVMERTALQNGVIVTSFRRSTEPNTLLLTVKYYPPELSQYIDEERECIVQNIDGCAVTVVYPQRIDDNLSITIDMMKRIILPTDELD